MESTSGSAEHLVVLVHGLWGNPSHLAHLEASLRKAFSEDELHILLPESNQNGNTYDGIETGGERVANEVEDTIEKLEATGRKITKISFVGYSLGGLISRYAIGLLYTNGWFDRIQPINYSTFATPHLGARTPSLGYHASLFNAIGARTLSASGQQLFLMDSFRDTGRPLLSVLADPSSIFRRGLALFKHRSLYSNILNDRSVPFYTACISRTDPFVDLSQIELRPLPGTEGVLLDPDEPFKLRPILPDTSLSRRLATTAMIHLQSLPFYVLIGVLFPIGGIVYFVMSGVQTFRSSRRLRLHESGGTGIRVDRYRKTPLLDEAKRVGESLYRGLTHEEREQYLPDPAEESKPHRNNHAKEHEHEMQVAKTQQGKKGKGGQFQYTDKFPTLALTDEQFAMIDSLDELGFKKFAVHITNVRHTHAAIVVRTKRKSFEQGKLVVAHWVQAFEV